MLEKRGWNVVSIGEKWREGERTAFALMLHGDGVVISMHERNGIGK